MSDDWRLTVTFADRARVRRAMPARQVADDVRQLTAGVVVSAVGRRLYLYTDTEDTARQAWTVVHEVLASRQMVADFALDRWHRVGQEWKDASVPLPETDDAPGRAGWVVRADLASHREAVELAGRLRGQGYPVIRRWRYLIVGAGTEDGAGMLAEAIRSQSPVSASVYIQAVPFAYVDIRGQALGEAAGFLFG